jgi:hypothetical protein
MTQDRHGQFSPRSDSIRLSGDNASGRAYFSEFGHLRDGSSHVNYAVYAVKPRNQ